MAELSQEEREELKLLLEKAALPWSGKIEAVHYPECDDADLPFVITDADGRHVVTLPEHYSNKQRDYETDAALILAGMNALPRLLASARVEGEPVASIEPDDIAWVERCMKFCAPVGHAGESTSDAIHRQALEDRMKRVLARLALSSEPIQAGWREAAIRTIAAWDRSFVTQRADWTYEKLADAILSQLPSGGEAPDGWRDIETAPKDGTEILLGAPSQSYQGRPTDPRVTVGHWTTEEESRVYVGDCGGECRCPEFDEVEPSWISWDGGFTKENPPTHWMPLPAPPPTGRVDANAPHQAREEANSAALALNGGGGD